MKVNVTGKQLEVTEAIRGAIENELKILNKYSDKDMECNAIIKSYHSGKKIELTLKLDEKHTLRQEVTDFDLYRAINLASEKLEVQIKKLKDRLQDHSRDSKKDLYDWFNEIEQSGDEITSVERRKKVDLKPMSEDEAILQFELVGHDFYMFEDANTSDVKVLYKRNDGSYGILES